MSTTIRRTLREKVYSPYGKVTHMTLMGPPYTVDSYCGTISSPTWILPVTPDEFAKAESMPICKTCAAMVGEP